MNPYLETAIEAVKIGGRILTQQRELLKKTEINRKQQFDFVTQVDLESEAAIIKYLRARHPEHSVLAEESGGMETNEGYVWIIDPLDGTKNYIHDVPIYAVSVGLQYNGEIIVGAILAPAQDELFYAERGKGAFLQSGSAAPKKLQVSQTTDLTRCLLATGFPFRAKHLTQPYFDAFISMFHKISDFRRAGAAALDLAYVACGRLDGFWEITLNLWDIAAGVLLVEEAGGKVTDLNGEATHLTTGNIAASNGTIHQEITATVGPVFKKLKITEDPQIPE